MSKKPELIVKLYAGDALVDQSTDAALWQRVLSEIRNIPLPAGTERNEQAEDQKGPPEPPQKRTGGSDVLSVFATELNVSVDDVRGGLDPKIESPFISLDGRSWEALKKNTPSRGPGGVAAAVLAGTALVLWQKCARTEDVTLEHVRVTLATIDLEDKNMSRSIANCDWLQMKGNRVVIHPSQMSSGIRLLKAYCLRQPPGAEN